MQHNFDYVAQKNVRCVDMSKKSLCISCEIGKRTYELDKHAEQCPYMYCYIGNKCSMYRKIKKRTIKEKICGIFRH